MTVHEILVLITSANSEVSGESAQTSINLRIMDVVERSTQIEQFNADITNMCVSNKYVLFFH